MVPNRVQAASDQVLPAHQTHTALILVAFTEPLPRSQVLIRPNVPKPGVIKMGASDARVSVATPLIFKMSEAIFGVVLALFLSTNCLNRL